MVGDLVDRGSSGRPPSTTTKNTPPLHQSRFSTTTTNTNNNNNNNIPPLHQSRVSTTTTTTTTQTQTNQAVIIISIEAVSQAYFLAAGKVQPDSGESLDGSGSQPPPDSCRQSDRPTIFDSSCRTWLTIRQSGCGRKTGLAVPARLAS